MMRAVLRAALVALAVVWMPVAPALAEPPLRPERTDPLPDRADVTFADLVDLVTPGLADLRHIDGEEWRDPVPETLDLKFLQAVPARSGGQDRMVLLMDFGTPQDSATGLVVLAAVDVTAEPRLLDAAQVAADRWTSFFEPARLPVGTGDDLLVTQSTHFNSYQGYAQAALILLRQDRLELVDWIAMLDDRDCGFERTQRLDIQPGAGAPFADITATVTEQTVDSDELCSSTTAPEPGTRTFAVTYHWDAAQQRYIADSDAIDVLAHENRQRF